MQYCPKCKVSVAGTQEVCPLCQGDLRGCPDEKNIFPDLAAVSYTHLDVYKRQPSEQ